MARLRKLQIPLLLFLIVTGFYWKLVLTNQYTWLHGPDYADQVLPWYQFEAGEWHSKRIPLWDPYEWAGQSLIGQGQPGVADPLNLPLFLWPLRRGWITQGALHWFYVLPHWLASMGFYKLCRDFGRSRTASVIAASLYTLGGIGGSLDWPQMMHATVWGPIAFLFQFRAIRGVTPLRNGVFSGFFLALAWLAGHHQVPMYFTLASFLFWIYFFVTSKNRKPIALAAAAAGAIMFLTSAVQTLPAFEYGQHALRWVDAEEALGWKEPVPYYVHQKYSMSPRSLLGIVIPGFDTSYPPTLGLVVIFLAVFGLVSTWTTERSTQWMTALGGFACAYSLGANTILQGIFYAIVPMVEKARVPAVAQILFDVAVCALFAAGLDRLNSSDWALWQGRIARACGAGGAILIATGIVMTILTLYGPGSEDRWMFTGWVGIACWILLRRPVRYASLWLGFLALSEVSGVTTRSWSHYNQPDRSHRLEQLATHSDIASYVRVRPGPPRLSVSQDDIPYSFGDWWGIETIEAQVPSVPVELFHHEVWSRKLNQLLSVRFYAGNKPRFQELREVYQSHSGLKLFEDPNAMPRLWTVHRIASVQDLEAAKAMLVDPATDLLTSTFLIGPAPKLSPCSDSGRGASYELRTPNRLVIHADLACKGMVIVPDLYDRGWIAKVDGKTSEVYQAYALVRGVVVEQGTHTIELAYRPITVIAGACLSLAGLLLTLGTAWKVRA